VFAELARRLGLDVLDGLDPEHTTEEDLLRQRAAGSRDGADVLFAAGAHGIAPHRLYGWVRRALPDGRWRLAPPVVLERLPALLSAHASDRPLLLICRRLTAIRNSVRHLPAERLPEAPAILLHPDDAAASDVREGDLVEVTSDVGSLECRARLDPKIACGVVSILHGSHETNVGRLTSSVVNVDPLTGEPLMTAIPVSLRRPRELAQLAR
jgi:anaerobic selenocysteine-containing dehydrogenase